MDVDGEMHMQRKKKKDEWRLLPVRRGEGGREVACRWEGEAGNLEVPGTVCTRYVGAGAVGRRGRATFRGCGGGGASNGRYREVPFLRGLYRARQEAVSRGT